MKSGGAWGRRETEERVAICHGGKKKGGRAKTFELYFAASTVQSLLHFFLFRFFFSRQTSCRSKPRPLNSPPKMSRRLISCLFCAVAIAAHSALAAPGESPWGGGESKRREVRERRGRRKTEYAGPGEREAKEVFAKVSPSSRSLPLSSCPFLSAVKKERIELKSWEIGGRSSGAVKRLLFVYSWRSRGRKRGKEKNCCRRPRGERKVSTDREQIAQPPKPPPPLSPNEKTQTFFLESRPYFGTPML